MTARTDNTLHPSTADFDAEVLQQGTPVLVDFYAPWCGPCRSFKPKLEALAETLGGRAKVAFVNIDDHPELAERFGILSIPALRLFKNGNLLGSANGALPDAVLAAFVERAL